MKILASTRHITMITKSLAPLTRKSPISPHKLLKNTLKQTNPMIEKVIQLTYPIHKSYTTI